MGSWGTAIASNDDYLDCYSEIIDLYNKGNSIDESLLKIRDKYLLEFEGDSSAIISLHFALAYTAWECGSKDTTHFTIVKEIVDSGRDIESWRELGASANDLKSRKKATDDFLMKIAIPKVKPKKQKVVKFKPALFRKGDILSVTLPDGKYTGAVVLEEIAISEEYGSNLIVKAFIDSTSKLTVEEIMKSKVYDYSWYISVQYKKFISHIEVIGNMKINNDYSQCRGVGSVASGWAIFVSALNEKHYVVAENRDIKDIQTFINFKSTKIVERQKQHVLNGFKKIL